MPAVDVCWQLPPCWGELARRYQRGVYGRGAVSRNMDRRECKESMKHRGVSQPPASWLGPFFCTPLLPCTSLFFVGAQLLPGVSPSVSPSHPLFPQPSISSTPLPSRLLFLGTRQSEPLVTGASQLSSFKTLVVRLLWSQRWDHM